MNRYYIIYKPYLVLSQFTAENEQQQTLKDYFDLPADVYPVGRLDYDSEGLLILTNDTNLNHRLLHPSFEHEREYWVQVDGAIGGEAIASLKKGVSISVNGKVHTTKKCRVKLLDPPPLVPDRNPPIRFRKDIPTSWISITLTEGKNRQVRKMTAAVGFPTLRLIRYRVEGIDIGSMQPGDIREIEGTLLFKKLFNSPGNR
jgi:23S rRNA pseudouridine2457 synthase